MLNYQSNKKNYGRVIHSTPFLLLKCLKCFPRELLSHVCSFLQFPQKGRILL